MHPRGRVRCPPRFARFHTRRKPPLQRRGRVSGRPQVPPTHPPPAHSGSQCHSGIAGFRRFTPLPRLLSPHPRFCTTCAPCPRGRQPRAAEARTAPQLHRATPALFSFTGCSYFPATFETDGCFTHATGVASRLLETANYFYQSDPQPWVCLQMSRSGLRKAGIFVPPRAPFRNCCFVLFPDAPPPPPPGAR
jgi:hypothetical protein